MITLLCAYCTTAEAFRILDSQKTLNDVLQTRCFADHMSEQGVSNDWTRALQTANKRLVIRFYYEDSKVVGWTYAGDPNINLNRKFHDTFSTCEQASNIAHELAHTLGYMHMADVAYATNYAFERCCP